MKGPLRQQHKTRRSGQGRFAPGSDDNGCSTLVSKDYFVFEKFSPGRDYSGLFLSLK